MTKADLIRRAAICFERAEFAVCAAWRSYWRAEAARLLDQAAGA